MDRGLTRGELLTTFTETIELTIRCPVCPGASDVVKHGKYGATQRFRCKDCGKTFRGGNIMPGKQIPPD